MRERDERERRFGLREGSNKREREREKERERERDKLKWEEKRKKKEKKKKERNIILMGSLIKYYFFVLASYYSAHL